MRKTFITIFSLGLLSLGFFSASAGGPVFWRVNTRAEVEKGDANGISIADNGAMTLAPSLTEVFDTRQAYIWSAASDNAGNIYLGTGNEGRVFKVDASGKGSLLYKTSELSVMALAIDRQGNVYAGTSPDGKVYRLTPGGEAKVFFEPKTKYIWSLTFDNQGRLLVGTGDKGSIFRVTPDGVGAVLAKTTQTNIIALRVDAAGNIIAGTDPGGMILRISPDGRAFTLFDSPQREVRDLAIGKDGEIYALALAESAGSGSSNAATATASAPTVLAADEGLTITISDVTPVDAAGAGTAVLTSSTAGGQSKSVLYRIDAGGASDTLWESRDAVAFAVGLEANGRIVVGTGQKGRIYSVKPGQNPLLLAQSSEAQTSRFVRAGNQLYTAASNLGKLFRLDSTSGLGGTYISAVRDAQTTANWGRISWMGEGVIEMQTRSGNTANPDSTWSEWSAPVANPEGEAIKSPAARYIQWRATLKRSSQSAQIGGPRLREATISYLPRNLAPRFTSLSMLPSGVTLQAALVQAPMELSPEQTGTDANASAALIQIPPRRAYQRGAVSFQWQAEDRNGDTIEYSVAYRNAAGGDYYLLKSGVRDNYFTVDANALPDGRYVFKVVASDAPTNPANLALTDDQETEPIEIDNTPPAVTTLTVDATSARPGSAEVIFRATDATSTIRRAEYQVDGGVWKSIFPLDGIADSKREEFRVTVAFADAKPHVVAFRAFDANGNIGSAQMTVTAR